MVFRVINGRVFGSGRPKRNDVKSEEQLKTRNLPEAIAGAWSSITEEQRIGWQNYADAFLPVVVNGYRVTRRGYDVFKQANNRLLLLGLELRQDPPVQAPPPPVASVALDPFTSAKDFSFRLTHPFGVPEGYYVTFMMTPVTPNPGRKALPRDLRMINGVGSQSAAPLCPSGGSIEFTDCRFPIEPGQRFMIETRVIRMDDGMASDGKRIELFR